VEHIQQCTVPDSLNKKFSGLDLLLKIHCY
jgi:hypothetical protein